MKDDIAKPRPIRFGVQMARAQSGAWWQERAGQLESLGYSTMFMPDVIGPMLSPLPALATAAASTTTLRVGTYVIANDLRNPLLLAREAATIDFLSDGRVELGMGAGRPGAEADNRQLGVPFDSIGERLDRLAEAVDIVKRLFAGEKVTATGRHYAIKDAELFPRPVQQPGPPILIAAGGPKALRRAARQADIIAIGVSPVATPAQVAERVGWIRESAGERFTDLELNVSLTVLPDGPDAAPARQAAIGMFRMVFGGDLEAIRASGDPTPLLVAGTADEIAEQVLAIRDTYGISYFAIPDFAADALAPVVERLATSTAAGNPAQR